MPIQVYECPKDGEFEIQQSILEDVLKKRPCPVCLGDSPHVLKPCGGIRIMRGWNEQANDYQRNPYTMAKAQAEHAYHELKDSGVEVSQPTESDIHKAAVGLAPSLHQKRKKNANG